MSLLLSVHVWWCCGRAPVLSLCEYPIRLLTVLVADRATASSLVILERYVKIAKPSNSNVAIRFFP